MPRLGSFLEIYINMVFIFSNIFYLKKTSLSQQDSLSNALHFSEIIYIFFYIWSGSISVLLFKFSYIVKLWNKYSLSSTYLHCPLCTLSLNVVLKYGWKYFKIAPALKIFDKYRKCLHSSLLMMSKEKYTSGIMRFWCFL